MKSLKLISFRNSISVLGASIFLFVSLSSTAFAGCQDPNNCNGPNCTWQGGLCWGPASCGGCDAE